MPTEPTSREPARTGAGSAGGSGVLAAIAASASEIVPSAGNLPVRLDDAGVAWFVERGALDVFVAQYGGDEMESALKHVIRVGPGRLAFGMDAPPGGARLRLVAKGLAGSRLRRVPLRSLLDGTAGDAGAGGDAGTLAAEVDAWIEELGAAIARDVMPRPRIDVRLAPAERVEAHGVVSAERGVVWLAGEAPGAAFLDTEEARPDGPGLIPVTRDTWVVLPRPTEVACRSSKELDPETLLFRALPELHRLALGAEDLNRRLKLVDEANLQVARTTHRHRDETVARQRLRSLHDRRHPVAATGDHPLTTALVAIGRHEGIFIRSPSADLTGEAPSLASILEASGVRARRVRLPPTERWWLGDSGAMLAFHRADGRPLALLPTAAGRYRLLDPMSGRATRVDRTTARRLEEDAWLLYRGLPSGGPARMKDLFAVAKGSLTADLARIAVAGLGAGVLTLAPAVAMGVLLERVVPTGAIGPLLQLTAVLVALALVATLLQMIRGTALMRLEGRVGARLGAALWDRMLRLKPAFFRRFTAGELAMRAMAFQTLRDRVSGVAAAALLSMLFLFPTFALLFLYNHILGWITLGIGLATLAVAVVFGALQVGPQRRRFQAERQLAGDLLQMVRGVGKLRSSGAEGSAFAAWARRYREQKRAEIHVARLSEHLTAFSAAIPALAGAALFVVALDQGSDQLPLADFLAVYAASMVFYASIVTLGGSFESIAAIVPGGEQAAPILAAEPDRVSHGAPAVLEGEVRFDRVSFRYPGGGFPIHEVSLHAKPGEFIAIVGESGSGKSTLVRLALGLEEPSSGAVYYDGRDLARRDHASVRRQIGTVVQDGDLPSGTVLDCIVGVTKDLTIDDAWRAARQAAVDRDIAAMPMGMYTYVSESAATFSGGQGQRIRIAAALVRRPRIVFLDEATSWLDTRSQAETMAGIEQSTATRIVIAHRLSTIRKANRIYVLQAGRVVQSGQFDELIGVEGPFRELARRQMA